MNKVMVALLSIPNTLLFNFKAFNWKMAIKMPVYISYKIKVKEVGNIDIRCDNIYRGMIRIGFGGSFLLGENNKGFWKNKGHIIFEGKTSLGRGTVIVISETGMISFGNNFEGNANCMYNSNRLIQFGNECLVGWDTTIIDGDGHEIFDEKGKKEKDGPIMIGEHVWICSGVKILKNTVIANESVVASNALLCKRFEESNILVGGYNKILEHNISWRK